MEAKELIQKAKDKAALELGWIDWVCFRADSDYLDQDIVIDRTMEIYARSLPSPPPNTVTDEEIEKEIDKGLARSDYPSYEKDSGYRSGFQACVKWSRDRLS